MMISVYITLGVLGLLLNFPFLVIIWTKPNVGPSIKCFLTNLAVANISINVMSLVFYIITLNGQVMSKTLCMARFLIIPGSLFSTLGTVAAIGIERIIVLRRPLIYRQIYTLKNSGLMVFSILLLSLIFSFICLPDFLASYSGKCLTIDLYPKSYATPVIATTLTIMLVGVIAEIVLFIQSSVRYTKSRNNASRPTQASRKLMVASRIALLTILFYTFSFATTIAYQYWVFFSNIDNVSLDTHDFTVIANAFLNCISLVDPFIYFISLINWDRVCNPKVHALQPPINKPGTGGDRVVAVRSNNDAVHANSRQNQVAPAVAAELSLQVPHTIAHSGSRDSIIELAS